MCIRDRFENVVWGNTQMFFPISLVMIGSWLIDRESTHDTLKNIMTCLLYTSIGSLIESPGFYPNLTGTENLRIFATLRGVPNNHAIKDALDLVGLPYKDKKLFSQYSLGMKQRLAIALAVMHDPELLILDERCV